MTETAPGISAGISGTPSVPRQAVSLFVLGLTDALEHALDETGIDWTPCDEPEDAAALIDDEPAAILAYGPGVFGRALSARTVRVERMDGEPIRSVILLDCRPDDLPRGAVDDDARRLAFKARIPLRVSSFVVLNDEAQVEALRRAVSTLS